MAIDYNDTITLMQAMERVKPPATFLLDTFFPQIPTPSVTTHVAVEYRKSGRLLAPWVTQGGKGINISRTKSKIDLYKAPMMAPKRVITEEDIIGRGFGETLYSSVSPAERATRMQARDLNELQNMIINRKNQMAAQILIEGKCDIKGYADDGQVELIDTVSFDEWNQKITPTTTWDNAGADIYGDLKAASEMVQENAGMIPTVAVCGKNISNYILGNESIMKWLAIPTAANLSLMSFQPRIISPSITRIGYIQSLNLELYCYMETYTDTDGSIKPFIGEDDVIIGLTGKGKQLHGAVTIVENKTVQTYSASYVPKYNASETDNELSLTIYSRCVLAPESVDDWVTIKTRG